MDKGLGKIWIGHILRDHEGKFLIARSLTKNFLVDPIVAEARAALQAVEFCREMAGFYDVTMEGDALQIFNTVKVKHKNWSSFGHIIGGIQERMRLMRSCLIEHIKRNANSIAHDLTREAIKYVINNV